MGAICSCCEVVQEYNPDGSPKPIQAKDQMKNDAPDLRRAACACDLEEMEKLLQRMLRKQICSGAQKKEVEDAEIGMTALHYSASANHLRGCVKLILYGADIDACDAKGQTPLHKQMELGYRKVAGFLLKRGASLNAQDKVGYTPLMIALHNGHKTAAEMIMEVHAEHVQQGKEGLNLSLCSKDGWSYALILAKLGWWPDLEQLLRFMKPGMESPEGREPLVRSLNIRSKEGDTLLGWVLRYTITGGLPLAEAVPLVKSLLDLGVVATTHAFAEDVPPVALAAAVGGQQLWDLIKEAAGEGALTRKDKLKRTPLHYASAKGHVWLVKQLLGCLRVDEVDDNKNTPLHLAALKGHPECIHMLLESAASALKPDNKTDFSPIERILLQPNKEGLSVLHLALSSGPTPPAQLAVLESLGKITDLHLHKDANLLVKGVVKETPLTLACQYHQHAVVKALLQERHVDVNEQTGTKETALVRCLVSVTKETARMDAAIFKLLIDAGANIDPGPGNEGNHPLMAVCKNDCNEFASLALAKLAEKAGNSKLDWDFKDPANGRTPLLEASLHNNAYVVKTILSQDTSKRQLKRTCNQGMTALCYAARGCSVDAMKILLNNKASVGCKDKSGKPVMSFCLGLDIPDSLTCAALLLRAGATPCAERDASGEGILHRAVRYGAADFIRLWARYGGDLMPKCTSPIAANLVVPTSKKYDAEIMGEMAQVEDEDAVQDDSVLDQDIRPLVVEGEEDEEEDEGLDTEGNPKNQVMDKPSQGNDSEECDVTGTIELVKDASIGSKSSLKPKDSGSCNSIIQSAASTTGSRKASFKEAVPVAEGVESEWADWGLDIQLGRDASGCMQRVPSFYTGPSATLKRKWMRQGSRWWNGWIDQEHEAFEHQANEAFSSIDDEDWNLEEKDGLLTLDDLYLVVADRQRLQSRTAAGPVSEALMDSVKGTLKKAGGEQLNKIVPFGGELVEDAINGIGVDNSMVPATVEEHNQSTAIDLVKRLFATRFEEQKINMELDPFYKPEKAYQGEPACMQADVSKFGEGIDRLVGSMFTRVASYDIQPSIPLQGADLRERNIRCWIMSLSPEAFPLKLGRWTAVSKMLDKAVKGARSRMAPSQKLSIRKRTALIGQPDLPTYPELDQTSALTYAVQLCRPDCVKALLDNDINQRLLGERDLWGHTALEYAMAMLARDKNNVVLQQMADLILIRRPVLGKPYIPPKEDKEKQSEADESLSKDGTPRRKSVPELIPKHNSMHPLCLAVVACDLPRIAWLVRCCDAPLDGSWMYAPDIPCHYKGLWEKLVGSTEAVFNPLQLSVLHKRMDVTKLVLDLGADPNVQSWGLATGVFGKSVFTQREDFLKECMKHRENALRGKPDPLGDGDQSALTLRKKQLDAAQKNMKEACQKKVEGYNNWLDQQKQDGMDMQKRKQEKKAVGMKLPNLLKKIKDFIEELVCGPDPWVSSLHLAARFGLSDICVLLLDRGATVMGGQAAGISRRTPFEEALKYARSNFRFDNCGAVRHNWLAFERHMNGMIPPMSAAARAKEARSKMNKLAKIMDPIALGIKAAIMAAKMVIDVLLDSFKRPIAHYDPALKAAHVLAWNRSSMMPQEAQTSILLRDLEDNGTWAWFGGSVTNVYDGNWIQAAQNELKELAEMEECNLKTAGETDDFKEYKKLVKTFKDKASSRYFTSGFKDFQEIYKPDLADRGSSMKAKMMVFKDQKLGAKARASQINMISRGELWLQGSDMKVNALREVLRGKHLYEAGMLVYEEPPLNITVQMADFDLKDEDSFLGGDKAAFLSSASWGASMRRTSSRKSGSTSGRNVAFSMAANCEPISPPSFSIETLEDVLGSNRSVPLGQLLPTEDLTEAILSGSMEKLQERSQVVGSRIEQKKNALKDTVAEIMEEAKKEAQAIIVEEGKKVVNEGMDKLGIGQGEAGDGGNSGDGGQPEEGDGGGPEAEPEDDNSGLLDASVGELNPSFGQASDHIEIVGIDVDGLKDSIKESLTGLVLDADMDINGLMAEFEDFQEMIDKIMEFVDTAAEAA